jgi:hypothetical protein
MSRNCTAESSIGEALDAPVLNMFRNREHVARLPTGPAQLAVVVKTKVQETAVHAVIGLTQPARVPARLASTHIDEHRFEQVNLRTV